MTTDSQDLQATLARVLEEFWEGYAGVRPAHVRVIVGEEAVAAWLGEVLSPAERQMARSKAGREVLQRLGERILDQAKPQLRRLVTDAIGQEDLQVEFHLNVAGRNIVGFFWWG